MNDFVCNLCGHRIPTEEIRGNQIVELKRGSIGLLDPDNKEIGRGTVSQWGVLCPVADCGGQMLREPA